MEKNLKDNKLLPLELPFSEGQQQWLNGYLAGLESAYIALKKSMGDGSGNELKPLLILFGSQTGNATSLAEDCAELAKNFSMNGIVKDMDDVSVAILPQYERILVITSTYGEGEMPDNAESLWQEITTVDNLDLSHTFYSVLALGDSSYEHFCLAGKSWDERLAQLGANRIFERVDCDVDFENKSAEWMNGVLPLLSEKGSQETAPPKGEVSNNQVKKPVHNRRNPLMAKLKEKRVLSQPESSKQIVHYEIDLAGSNETYEAGDVLNIMPRNREDIVAQLLDFLKASKEELVSWQGSNYPAGQLLSEKLEIRMPSREFFDALMQRCQNDDLHARFNKSDDTELDEFLYGRDILDFLAAYPDAAFTVQDLVGLLKPLAPRAYSISSSMTKHQDAVHVTIGSVRYELDGREHYGVASTWLADELEIGDIVPCYFSANKHFSVPEDSKAKMIMVGPGTGIAPFRAFLEAREVRGDKGDNWLFFGDRNRKNDFIYKDEILNWQQSGLLTRLDLAFSRDQKEKIYVQDKMYESGKELFAWLEAGAYLFVCGDALRMAKDVDKALSDIIIEYGSMDETGAQEYIANLKKEKRYVRDVY